EDLPRELLTDLSRQVRGPEPAVEARHVRVGLLEARVLTARQGQIADDVQAVAAARRPSGHDADHDLGHEADQPLDLQDVESTAAGRIDVLGRLRRGCAVIAARGVAVAVRAADALVAPRAEGPAPVAR